MRSLNKNRMYQTLKKYRYFFIFLLLMGIGFYLRFYKFESLATFPFGWDQARDAWKARDIVHGMLVLDGPKTGIGQLHLGPLYFYFLAPFFALTKLDPVASIYFNMLANAINFFVIYFITKKLFSPKAALFTIFVYSISSYIIAKNQIPWNVSLVPAVSLLIFYSLYQIRTTSKKYWYVILGLLVGFFFHLHFTVVFLPPIIFLSLFPFKKSPKEILYLAGAAVIASLFVIPTLIFDLKSSHGELNRYNEFVLNYTHGFHLRFLVTRIADTFVQFKLIYFFQHGIIVQYIIPVLFLILTFIEKDKKKRLIELLIIPWFIIPLLGFTVYAGPISDYYYIYQAPLVIYILYLLQQKMLSFSPKFLVLFIIFWVIYAYSNTKGLWIKPTGGGLELQKKETLEQIKTGEPILYHEGSIKAYIYAIWTEDYPRK